MTIFQSQDISIDSETERRIKFAVNFMRSKKGQKEKFYHSYSNGVNVTILRQKVEGVERLRICLSKYLAEIELTDEEL